MHFSGTSNTLLIFLNGKLRSRLENLMKNLI